MIAARGLCKRFGAADVLRSLDIDIARGRVTAIVGPNGAGKTTFIKSVLGLTRPDAGELTFEGNPIRDDDRYRERIGYLPQIARFPENLTAHEFLHFLEELRNVRGDSEPLIDDFSLRAELHKQLRVLSGGTKQKVNAVAAFMFAPTLYVLDEPTAGLDPVSAGVMKRLIRDQRERGHTVIITSHILSEIDELADDIVYLHEGRATFAGSVTELRDRTGQPTLERAIAALMMRNAA